MMRPVRIFANLVLALCLALPVTTAPAFADASATALVNSLRKQNGAAGIKYSGKLEKIAARHAAFMARQRSMTHTGAGGTTAGQRARKGGYHWCYISENIAKGPWDMTQVIRQWAASPSHARNMYSRKAREFAVAEAGDGYWVMVLAKPGCRR